MRISDWSSDVCSSDLSDQAHSILPGSRPPGDVEAPGEQSRQPLSLSVLRYEAPAQAADYQALGRTLPGRRDRDGSARQSSSRGQTGSGSGPDGDVAGPRDSRP